MSIRRQKKPKELTNKEAEKEAKRLREDLRRHNQRYYVEDDPEIADAEYDELKQRLIDLEEAYPDLRTPDSPTQRVGGPPREELGTVHHDSPMLSLRAVKEQKEVEKFFDDMIEATGNDLALVAEPKYDGLSIELVYERGSLVQASTRGDGTEGEEVTANVKTIGEVPLKLRPPKGARCPNRLVVRGEIYMPISAFNKFNQAQEKAGKKTFANPRNAASGSLRQLDPKVTAERPLGFFAWQLESMSGKPPTTHYEGMQLLRKLGLKTADETKRCSSKKAVVDWYEQMAEKRESLDYEIDGCVFKVDALKDREDLGTRAANPRWAIAWKFESRRGTTRIQKIRAQVGRTGAVTPVADLEPVEIGGTTVEHVTLHNQDEIERLEVTEGDRVLVERAGDVIPHVVRVTKKKGSHRQKYRLPKKCPVCGSELVRPAGEAVTRCPNTSCPARIKESIRHFASKGTLDIDGLGEKLVEQLVESGAVEKLDDLFRLKKKDLAALERMGAKSAENLLKSIDKAKEKVTLPRLIYGLGIPHVGQAVAADLAAEFGSIEALRKAKSGDLEKLDGIGPVMAEAIAAWTDNEANRKLIGRLEKLGIDPNFKTKSGPLKGKTLVVTGTLDSMPRDEAKEAILAAGGKATSSVSSETDWLVVGKNPGQNKTDDADEHDVERIDEKELLRKLGKGG